MEKDKIRVLPDGVANQIAAGEVVGRPASVVKELMENAVDAGARNVTVHYKEGGRALIQVVDDGCGMSPGDARVAFERHATSKISLAKDLYELSTFGFRGEALPSIASVSEVELKTRTSNDDLGTRILIHGGHFISQEPVQNAPGTQFLIRNLFYNVPARRRFLREASSEGRHIRNEFLRVALCNSQVSFMLYDNEQPVLQLPSANLRQRIIQAIGGREIAKNMLDVKADTSLVQIEGFVGNPSSARKTNREQYLFVNGRYFQSPYFRKAILQAYEKLTASDVQPSYFLYLTLDPHRIDVNVHPQKTEIKFDDEQAIWQIINASVRESLGKLGIVPMMDFEIDSSIDIPVYDPQRPYKFPDTGANPAFNPFREGSKSSSPSCREGGTFSEEKSVPSHWEQLFETRSHDRESDGDPRQFKEYDSAELEFIRGDDASAARLPFETEHHAFRALPIGKRYCVAPAEQGLMFIDLPRALERVLYERYCGMLNRESSVSQQLLFDESIPLNGEELQWIRDQHAVLESLGFDLETASESVTVHGIPSDLSVGEVEDALRDLILTLRDSADDPLDAKQKHLAEVLARHGARRAGLGTDPAFAQSLLADLFACREARYTPSGLPVVNYMTFEEISKRLTHA